MDAQTSLEQLAPSRVMFCGDLHGSLATFQRVLNTALRHGTNVVVAVGDVGLCWPGDGARYTNALTRACERVGATLVVVDGNHEGWAALNDQRSTPQGPVHISERVIWADRGSTWTWTNRRFGALGGARSVDWRNRREGTDIWIDLEAPTVTEAEQLIAAGPVDVLITHDAPIEAPVVGLWDLNAADQSYVDQTRHLISSTIAATRVGLNIHGHWHQHHDSRLTSSGHSYRCVGLSHDLDPHQHNWVLLDLDTLDVHSPADKPRANRQAHAAAA